MRDTWPIKKENGAKDIRYSIASMCPQRSAWYLPTSNPGLKWVGLINEYPRVPHSCLDLPASIVKVCVHIHSVSLYWYMIHLATDLSFRGMPPQVYGDAWPTHKATATAERQLHGQLGMAVFVFTLDCNNRIYCYDTEDALL